MIVIIVIPGILQYNRNEWVRCMPGRGRVSGLYSKREEYREKYYDIISRVSCLPCGAASVLFL